MQRNLIRNALNREVEYIKHLPTGEGSEQYRLSEKAIWISEIGEILSELDRS